MGTLNPVLIGLIEQIQDQALALDHTEEYFPWGTRSFFRELKGCNFLLVVEQADHLEFGVRLTTSLREEALKLSFVEPHKYLSHKGWITANLRTADELETVLPWIATSYQLNKPFPTKADSIDGENGQVLDFLEQVREKALSYGELGEIEEYFPFGDRVFRRIKGLIFLYASEQLGALSVSVRLPMGEREFALQLPFIKIPKYIGHKGWVQATVQTQEQLDIVMPWIDVSYEMNQSVRKGRPKKVKAE